MREKGAAGAADALPRSVPQALGRHTEGPAPSAWGFQVHGMLLTPGTGREVLSGHSGTQTHPKVTQLCSCWGLHWDAGRAGVQLDCPGWIFVPPALAKPNEVLNQVRGNFSTGRPPGSPCPFPALIPPCTDGFPFVSCCLWQELLFQSPAGCDQDKTRSCPAKNPALCSH